MLIAAGLNGVWHHRPARQLYATAQWSPDQIGLTMLGLVIGWLVPIGSPAIEMGFDSW